MLNNALINENERNTKMRAKFETKKWGVEIELNYPSNIGNFSRLATKIKNAIEVQFNAVVDIAGHSYGHNLVSNWKVLSDMSLRSDSGFNSAEIVSPPLKGNCGLKELEMVLWACRSIGCKINLSTGIHVHHDINNWKDSMFGHGPGQDSRMTDVASKFSNLISLVSKFETIIYRLQPASRRGNMTSEGSRFLGSRWCRSMNDTVAYKMFASIKGTFRRQSAARKNTMKSIVKYARMNNSWGRKLVDYNSSSSRRYCGFNLEAFWRHGTVEFRYSAGSLNFTKIKNWIVFTQSFVLTAEWLSENNKGVNNTAWDFSNLPAVYGKMKVALGMRSASAADEHYVEAGKWVTTRLRELNPELSTPASAGSLAPTYDEQWNGGFDTEEELEIACDPACIACDPARRI